MRTLLVVVAAGLAACGAATATSQTSPSPSAGATPPPTPTPTPLVADAHRLTFQAADIPAGFSPHSTSIMTLDAKTVVSEDLVSDGSILAQLGSTSGAEYGWEATGSGRLAVQNAVIVVRDAGAAATLLHAIQSHLRGAGAPSVAPPATVGEETIAFQSARVAILFWRHGPIVAGIEVTDGSMPHALSLAKTLESRYAPFPG